jgi:NTP pyrophosphatase (non-canonical NTP hydrolase)
MELNALQELAKTRLRPESTAKTCLDAVRKDLFDLWGRSTRQELEGKAEDFAGPDNLTKGLGDAVLNLFCLAHVFGIDLASAIERRAEAGTHRNQPSQAQPEKVRQPSPGPQDGNGVKPDDKETKIEHYRKALRDAGNQGTLEKTWKEVIADKSLEGKDKAALQKDYIEKKKGLPA